MGNEKEGLSESAITIAQGALCGLGIGEATEGQGGLPWGAPTRWLSTGKYHLVQSKLWVSLEERTPGRRLGSLGRVPVEGTESVKAPK